MLKSYLSGNAFCWLTIIHGLVFITVVIFITEAVCAINPNFRNNYFIFNDEKFDHFSNENVDDYKPTVPCIYIKNKK